jgi:glycine cleavage system H protein
MGKNKLFYSEEHLWALVEGEKATIGITDYAQKELGDITYVELPSMGDKINQSAVFATLESVKSASDLYAPLSGTVTAINTQLETRPELINSSADKEGWLCRISIGDISECESLMSAGEYEEYIKES